MTSSSRFLTNEADEEVQQQQQLRPPSSEEDDDTPTHFHRRRWSTPIDSDDFTVSDNEENRTRGVSGLNLEEFFSCSSDNSYSFYLGQKMSPWGSSGPPLLRGGGQRRGGSKTVTTTMTEKKRDLPPFLTTLDCNGRPRFHHRRVRSEGRLEIASVAVDSPEIVSVRGREGLRIGTVRISQQDQ